MTTKFKVGDIVSWTQTRRRGNTLELRSVQGRIEVLIFDIRAKVQRLAVNGRKMGIVDLPLSGLRLESERSELTELVMGKKEEEK